MGLMVVELGFAGAEVVAFSGLRGGTAGRPLIGLRSIVADALGGALTVLVEKLEAGK